jgi:isoleucyl-tRNA synthetase
MGADILRLWVAATDYRAEMSISDEILTRMADSYRRIRNTMRYLLASLSGFETSALLAAKDMLSLDQWALQRAHDLQKEILQAYEEFQFHLIYQKLHQFCVVDMGGFYLDILKDRMYTMPANSRGRRSAQTAMFHILEALVRWLAPVLTFTAEEVWRHMPGKRSDSVFLEQWHALPALPERALDMAFWNEVIAVRQTVAKELEKLRVAGNIGSGLDAEVDLYGDDSWQERLRRLGDELRFVFITSYARVHGLDEKTSGAVETEIKGLYVRVAPSSYPKCIRCWHHREDVGANQEHPQICGRCVQNVTGPGETRSYA